MKRLMIDSSKCWTAFILIVKFCLVAHDIVYMVMVLKYFSL